MHQIPAPGSHCLYFSGDVFLIKLCTDTRYRGKAFFRTNLGNAMLVQKEIVDEVESGHVSRGKSWNDVRMSEVSPGHFELKLSLLEVGHFEGKCLFFPEGEDQPFWEDGGNTQINVAPSDNCAGNMVYCAFPRQFGRHKGSLLTEEFKGYDELVEKGYSVIPPSGTFRDLMQEMDFIFDDLKCRILHLLPVNPTPTVYGRMGVFGSPYAALDFTAVDPSLADFDRSATPLEQFCELCDAVHFKSGKVFIDIAINHTGWAAKIHEEHPEWLVREEDGTIKSPGAWGVTWGDLTELDHSHKELWKYLADIFIIWCGRGVDGFRCDAGYMIPMPVWRYIIAQVRIQYPDTVFLLEGLGGDPKITEDLLNAGNMDWAYSELFQNYTKQDITNYIGYSNHISRSDGLMFHYAETHDNARLAATSHNYSMMRTGLAALLSVNGAFGFTNGVEWFAEEKIDVHHDSGLNWGSEKNQVKYISRLNTLLLCNPAFHANSTIDFMDSHGEHALVFSRTSCDKEHDILILVNLDSNSARDVTFTGGKYQLNGSYSNLLTGEKKMFFSTGQNLTSTSLLAGECVCIVSDSKKERCFLSHQNKVPILLDPVRKQRSKVMALSCLKAKKGSIVVNDEDVSLLSELLLKDPKQFYQEIGGGGPLNLVDWQGPRDLRREVMVAPNHAILIQHAERFRVKLSEGSEVICQYDSLEKDDGTHFVIVAPLEVPSSAKNIDLTLISYHKDGDKNLKQSQLLLLSTGDEALTTTYHFEQLMEDNPLFLAVNEAGGICHVPVKWGEINSRYDGLLMANLHNQYPVDRHVMFTRARCWVKHQGYSHALSVHSLESFRVDKMGSGVWHFHLPVGNGKQVCLQVTVAIADKENKLIMKFERSLCADKDEFLEDTSEIELIIRPDIEDRNFHTDTKAMTGPQEQWSYCVNSTITGFKFMPSHDRVLKMSLDSGVFMLDKEWSYSNYHSVEASRGLEAHSDLFSPGFFKVKLRGGKSVNLIAGVNCQLESEPLLKSTFEDDFESILKKGMLDFVVKRDDLKTVIAGYPWFLDWGRDTLICVRGLISSGDANVLSDVAGILHAFAKFELKGTLPNMIHGNDAANRETSDAPLWFFTAVKDYCKEMDSQDFLSTKPSGCDRTIQEILISIADHYILGTSNGIKVDSHSGLVFSPSHFTWMDTNYPAGTPRIGYPIEIQSLWFGALVFLGETTGNQKWVNFASQVQESIVSLYTSPDRDYLADCLHCSHFLPARDAVADDALRSNQLLAVTLGAVTDRDLMKEIVHSSEELLIPGGIRSLADRPVDYHLPIYGAHGQQLNDPINPFWPTYEGDEDSRRKPAYHNGTAWTWPFPSWSEAYFMVYGDAGKETAKAILSSSKRLIKNGCVGHIPEIIDGGAPHLQRGCDAQAWGVTELYRIWKMLN